MDEVKATAEVAQEPLLLTEDALNELVDILLSIKYERRADIEPAADHTEVA